MVNIRADNWSIPNSTLLVFSVYTLTLCLMFPSSCLPDLLPPLFHHVRVVLLEDHLHQAWQPLQRGTLARFNKAKAHFRCIAVTCCWHKVNPVVALGSFFIFPRSSSAYPKLRKSVTRRRRGQSPSKRSYGELPPVYLCTPAQEPEVRLTCVSKCERVCFHRCVGAVQ